MKMDKKDHKPLPGARKNIKKVRKSLVTSGFFKKSGDIFFGATSQKTTVFTWKTVVVLTFRVKMMHQKTWVNHLTHTLTHNGIDFSG